MEIGENERGKVKVKGEGGGGGVQTGEGRMNVSEVGGEGRGAMP